MSDRGNVTQGDCRVASGRWEFVRWLVRDSGYRCRTNEPGLGAQAGLGT
jgi:hypothetical protein